MQAVSLDKEHAEMLLRAQEGQEKKAWNPPMATWSPEAAVLADVVDAVRGLTHVTLAVNSKSKPNPPMPYARPRTAIEQVRYESRSAKHKALVARMLPHKKD